MNAFINDIKFGIRMLKKSPVFTFIALITLAIGIGANVIMFSFTDMLLFRPVGVKEPEQLTGCDISNYWVRYSIYQIIRNGNQVFSDLIVQSSGNATLIHKEMTRRVNVKFVSGNYFPFLGVVPTLGRGFLPDDDQQDTTPVVILSYRTWQRHGANPAIIGQHLRINGVSCQVVGVAPKGFTGTTLTGPDLWMPMGGYLSTMVLSRGGDKPREHFIKYSDLGYPNFYIMGRLRPDISLSAAESSLQALVPVLRADAPRNWTPHSKLYLYPAPRINDKFRDKERLTMKSVSLFLMGISLTILIIACLNLANMLMIRGAGRSREIAVRMALGGGRLRIVRQLFIESLLLALLGGLAGLILALWGTKIINTWFASVPKLEYRCLKISPNIRVLGMTLGMSIVATLLFGLRPALRLSRRNIIGETKESSIVMLGHKKNRRGNLSAFWQIVLAVVVVMVAAMFTQRSLGLLWPDHNLDLDNTLVVVLDPMSAGHDRKRSIQICEALADRLESLPGIDFVGMSPSFSFGYFGSSGPEKIYRYIPGEEGQENERFLAKYPRAYTISRDYFSAVELPLLQGRPFNRLDSVPNAENVVIIDEILARKLDPNGNALGALIRYGTFDERSEPYRVVGIVPHIPDIDIDTIYPQTYQPVKSDQMSPCFYLHLENSKSSTNIKQWISEVIRQGDTNVPVLSIATLAHRYRDHNLLWITGTSSKLTGIAGTIVLFLAALGICAVKGYMVASRTREIGIRKALGATNKNIIIMVYKEGLMLTVVGLVFGLLLGLGATRVIASVLSGYHAAGPIGIALTVALLGIVSLLAGYGPTRKAAKIDPMEALRYE